jgi:methionine--tRNA ligase beta chain
MKEKIEFKELLEIEKKLEIKVGTIKTVERVEGSDKMLKLTVNLGEEEDRVSMTNIGNLPGFSGENEAETNLTGIQMFFITNLKPAKMMGIESTAMILPVMNEENMELKNYTNGSKLM